MQRGGPPQGKVLASFRKLVFLRNSLACNLVRMFFSLYDPRCPLERRFADLAKTSREFYSQSQLDCVVFCARLVHMQISQRGPHDRNVIF